MAVISERGDMLYSLNVVCYKDGSASFWSNHAFELEERLPILIETPAAKKHPNPSVLHLFDLVNGVRK